MSPHSTRPQQDERLFRLDRMSRLRVSGPNPKSPDFEERPFDASDYYMASLSMFGE